MKKRYLLLVVLITLILQISCKTFKSSGEGTIKILKKEKVFTYSGGKEELIDINNDKIPDFKCMSERAGNRSRKLIVPIGKKNKIVGSKSVLEVGQSVSKETPFADRFDFNNLGNGANAFLMNKYLGVQFKIKNRTHYGWIKFSSNADGTKTSNTPIYYHKITIDIHETGYNQSANKSVKIN